MKNVIKILKYTGITLVFFTLIIACGICVWYTAINIWNLVTANPKTVYVQRDI